MKQLIGGFFEGVLAYFRVVPLFVRLKLWRFVGLTALIALLTAASIIALSVTYGPSLGEKLVHAITEGAYPLVQMVVSLAVSLIILLAGLLIYKHLVLILAAPWMSIVAERVARATTQSDLAHAHTHPIGLIVRSARLNSRLFVRELLLTIPVFICTLVPVLTFPATVILLTIQAYFVGAGVLDYGLERDHNYVSSIQYFKNNRGLLLGIGAGFILLTLSVVGILVAPAWSVSAASYAYSKRVSRV